MILVVLIGLTLLVLLFFVFKDLIVHYYLVNVMKLTPTSGENTVYSVELPKTCQDLAMKNWRTSNPVPICSNSRDAAKLVGCSAMSSGKCTPPTPYGMCPGSFRFNNGRCVQ